MKAAIVTALAVGFIGGFYNFFIQTPLTLNLNSPSFAVDETFFYAPRAARPLNYLGELIPSSIMRLLTIGFGSMPAAFSAADFIFPALTFLALFWLTRSIIISLSALIFYHYLTYFPYLPSVIKMLIGFWQNGSYWTAVRAFHPQISLGLWFIFVKYPHWLTLTLLTYTDFFCWTAGLAWLIMKRYLKPLGFWLILTLPYWISVAKLLPAADYWQRNYYFALPTINQLLLLAFGLTISFWQKRWRGFYAGITWLTVAATLIRFGADDPIGHWFLRVVNPMTAILLFTLIFRRLKLPKIAAAGLAAIMLLCQFRWHWQYFKNNAAAFLIEPERLAAFNWLKNHTPQNSVVAAGMKDSLYLPAYTHNQPYLLQAQLSQIDNSELIQRFIEVYKLAKTDLRPLFVDNQALIAGKRFDFDACAGHFLFFRLYNKVNYYSCTVPESVLSQLLTQYQQVSAKLTYPADYWLGTEPIDFGRLVWENQSYKIYALP